MAVVTAARDVAHANLPLVDDAAVGMHGVHGTVQVHAFVSSGTPQAKPLAPAQQHVEVVVVVVVQPGRRAVLAYGIQTLGLGQGRFRLVQLCQADRAL
jgi:hypothetical protein